MIFLSDADPWDALNSNTKRNIKTALKHGVEPIDLSQSAAIEAHLVLIDNSLDRRRNLNENVGHLDYRGVTTRLIRSGYGKLFQSGTDATALSSAFVVLMGDMAYYNMGGTGPVGIQIGASHLNMYEAIKWARDRGATTFDMGIANTEGLVKFKTGFGATEIRLQRKYYRKPMGLGMVGTLATVLAHKLRSCHVGLPLRTAG